MAKESLIELRSIGYVPLAERHGKVHQLWPVWFSGDANIATLAVGVIGIAMGGSFWWTLIAVTGGCALGTFFMAFHSTQGPQLGLPQLIQSRPQFGYLGALLVWVVALVAYIGYNAFNSVLGAQAVRQLMGAHAPSDTVIIVALMLLALAIATAGYDWIHRAQRLVAYTLLSLLSLFTLGLFIAVPSLPPTFSHLGAFQLNPFLVQFFAAAAYQISWSIYVSDYSRYLPPDVGVGASFFWTYVGAFVGGLWMMLLGTISAAMFPQAEISAAVQLSADAEWRGFGVVLLGGSLLGLVTISTCNFYGASLTLLSVADCVRPHKPSRAGRIWSLGISAVASIGIALLASREFAQRFDQLLAVLLYLMTPWTAINLVDFYVVRKSTYSVREIFNPDGLYGRWNWRGLVAYGVGFASMVPFFSTHLYTGPIARHFGGADLAMLVGLPVSSLVYLWACRSIDIEAERAAVRQADRDLDAKPA